MLLKRERYRVGGMSCAACAAAVERALRSTDGVAKCSVSIATHQALVEYDPAKITQEALRQVVMSAGYQLIPKDDEQETSLFQQQRAEVSAKRKRFIHAAIGASLVMLNMLLGGGTRASQIVQALIAAYVVFVVGREFYSRAWKQLWHGGATMDTLIALSTSITYTYSLAIFTIGFYSPSWRPSHLYFDSASMIIAFVLLGKWLEGRASAKTHDALEQLVRMQPQIVHVILGSRVEDRPLASVRKGDRLLVRPGENVPVDGTVIAGSSYVDESPITGESLTVSKTIGDPLYAGTANQQGAIGMEAQKIGSETLLGQIIARVEEAKASKAPVQRLADRVSAWFVPLVILFALLTFSLWLILGGLGVWRQGLISAVAVLAIACPCALGLATPTAFVVGLGRAARKGFLVRDAAGFESLSQVNLIVFDKTGTLTESTPQLVEHYFRNESEADSLKRIIVDVERLSTHPFAKAIVAQYAVSLPDDRPPTHPTDFKEEPGRGVTAQLNGDRFIIASLAQMLDENVDVTPLQTQLTRAKKAGYSIVAVAKNSTLEALLCFSDRVRPGAKEAIHELHQMRISTTLLSGDRNASVAWVAEQLKIDNWLGEQLPARKEEYVAEMMASGRIVAMVGDGVNDSQAMVTANASIAMGEGAQVAIGVATLTHVSGDLLFLPWIIRLSQKTMRIVRENLFWAFGYNVLAIPIAAGALYPLWGITFHPMYAALAMALSSVCVVTNSLRLARIRVEKR